MVGRRRKEFCFALSGIIALLCGILYAQLLFAQDYSSSRSQATYVGVDRCKTCHPRQYKDFSERKFDKSWKVLKMRQEEKNPKCLPCHTTGYGKPGGFVSEAETPELVNKQCEACHGPGASHASNARDLAAKQEMKGYVNQPNVCTDCHQGVFAHRIAIEGF